MYRSLMDDNTNQPEEQVSERSFLRSCLFTVLSIVGGLTLGLTFIYWFLFPAPKYVGNKPYAKPYTFTKFEFRYGDATWFVDDPYNKMQWVLGDLPDSIAVDATGARLIVYNSHNAILKSWADSFEVYPDSVHHKGYMGMWEEGTHFRVDSSGVVE